MKHSTHILPDPPEVKQSPADDPMPSGIPVEELRREAIEQIAREREIEREDDIILDKKEPGKSEPAGENKEGAFRSSAIRANFRMLLDFGKSRKISRLIIQIWQSDYTIVAYILTVVTFFLMKRTEYPAMGVLFFLLAMSVVDAILAIFVTRLSVHQNKHSIYSSEDFARDWLRYKILLSMTKAALLFVVGTSCGTAAVVGAYVMWFFTSTQRLRYIILRWSMNDHFPELERWSVFGLLREAGVKPKLRNYNIAAVLGVILGFTIALVF